MILLAVPKRISANTCISWIDSYFQNQLSMKIDLKWDCMNEYNFYSNPYFETVGIFIAFYQDRKEEISFEAYEAIKIQQELDRLNRIKLFMEQSDYAEKKEKFKAEWESYSKETDGFLRQFQERERLSPIKHDVFISQQYHEMQKSYKAFLDENQLMWDSYLYELTRTNPQTVKVIPDPCSGEIIEQDNPSNCIYDVIDTAKQGNYEIFLRRFTAFRNFLLSLLETVQSVGVVSCSNEDGDCQIDISNSIKIADLKIEDLVFLKDDHVLLINT